jgi:hydrogenase nickel incorporation protein HypA/HybF
MHEMGVAMEVIRIAQQEAMSAGTGRIVGMKVRVGRWSGVEAETLRFSLNALTEGTALQGCRMELLLVEPQFACSRCGSRYRGESYLQPCPECGGGGALVAGDELTLAELEVEDS